MILPLAQAHIPAVTALFNRAAEEETLYKSMTEAQCGRFFFPQTGEDFENSVLSGWKMAQ